MPEIPPSLLKTYSNGGLRYGIVIKLSGNYPNEFSYHIVNKDGLFHIPANLIRLNKRWNSAYKQYFHQKRMVRQGSAVVFMAMGTKYPFYDVSALEILDHCYILSPKKISLFFFC